MGSKKTDVIGGFDNFLKEQRELPDECRLTLVKFNSEAEVVYSSKPLADVPSLAKTYQPGGNTALFDAVAKAVKVASGTKTADERVLCIVITDGEENASTETTLEQIKALIEQRTADGSWTFTYIGADVNKWSRELGLSLSNTLRNSVATPAMVKSAFMSLNSATTAYRSNLAMASTAFYNEDPALKKEVQNVTTVADD